MRRFLKYWLPVLIWLSLIFIGSTDLMSAEHTSRFIVPFLRWLKPDISREALAQIHFLIRKFGHIAEYAILATLLWRAFRGTLRSTRTLSIMALAFGVAALFAASDEFHQSFVPTRGSSPKDVLIDSAGAIVGLLICLAIFGTKKARR